MSPSDGEGSLGSWLKLARRMRGSRALVRLRHKSVPRLWMPVVRIVSAPWLRARSKQGTRSRVHDLAARGSRKRSKARRGDADLPCPFLKDIMGVPFPVASIAVRHARSPDRARQAAELRLMPPAGAGLARRRRYIERRMGEIGARLPGHSGRRDEGRTMAHGRRSTGRCRHAVAPCTLAIWIMVASRIIAAVHKVVELTKPRIARVNEGGSVDAFAGHGIARRLVLPKQRRSAHARSGEMPVGATNLFKFGYRS